MGGKKECHGACCRVNTDPHDFHICIECVRLIVQYYEKQEKRKQDEESMKKKVNQK